MFSIFAPASQLDKARANHKQYQQQQQKKEELARKNAIMKREGSTGSSSTSSRTSSSSGSQQTHSPPIDVESKMDDDEDVAIIGSSVINPITPPDQLLPNSQPIIGPSPTKRQKTSGNLLQVGCQRGIKSEQTNKSSSAPNTSTSIPIPISDDGVAPMDISQSSSQASVSYSQLPKLEPMPPSPSLVGHGQPQPIDFSSYQPTPHIIQPHQNPWLSQQQHRQAALRQQPPSRRGGGGGRGRSAVIRGPHRIPQVHEIEDDDDEGGAFSTKPEPKYNPLNYLNQFSSTSAAVASGSSDVVDLTQEDTKFNVKEETGIKSETRVKSEDAYVYNPFASSSPSPPVSAYDPYAAAFRSATSSDYYNSPPAPAVPAAKPISATQFSELSKEQQAVILAIRKGENVFFSGCAGTGKSHLLKLLAQYLPRHSTFFTASTGLAAVNIGGSTLHSFAGIGLGEGSAESLAVKARGNKNAYARWRACKVLIVDEISMIAGTFFDKLEYIARYVRQSEEPFGGIQLVLSGDFLQLPPVKSVTPTFGAESWNRCIQRKIVLTTVFRQKGDPVFIELLNNLRVGSLTLKQEALLKKSHYTPLPEKHGVVATKLNATKKDTASENDEHLEKLEPKVSVYFKSIDWSAGNEGALDLLKKNCPAPEHLRLKKGAQVMLLRNIDTDSGLCNGSRGVVVDFVRCHDLNPNGGFAFEQPSDRTPGSENIGISAEPFYWTNNENERGVMGRVEAKLGNMEELVLLPRVQFDNGELRVIESDKWEITVQEKIQARRTQIPLQLAWSLTIHKSQGMTLERAEINGSRMFENGQLYVAVSRVKSLQGLKLLGFTRDSLRTDMKVVEWYRQLEKETTESTAELLREVDNYFPELEKQIELERAQNVKEQQEQKAEEELRKKGPFATAAAHATAAAAASTTSSGWNSPVKPGASRNSTPSPTSSSSTRNLNANGFQRASTMVTGVKREISGAVKSEVKSEMEAAVKAEYRQYQSESSPAASSIFATSPIKAKSGSPARPSPQAFRSPLRNPVAAAISTAMANSILTGEDVIVNTNSLATASNSSMSTSAVASSSSNSSFPASQPVTGLCCCCKDGKADHAIFECLHMCLCHECKDNFTPTPEDEDTPITVGQRWSGT